MFSYLETVSVLVDKNLYNRGLRYYLEGKIVKQKDLTLDYWRTYYLSGKEDYEVQIPLLHLALSPSKFSQAPEALKEVVQCNCLYYQDYGICKHIVAVCASLEQEFNFQFQGQAQKVNQKVSEDVLESIFQAEHEKNIRHFRSDIDQYFNTNSQNISWFEQLVAQSSRERKLYQQFLEEVKERLREEIRVYEKERKILLLMTSSLKYGSLLWWEFWQELLPELTPRRKSEFWLEVWRVCYFTMAGEFQSQAESDLQNFSPSAKSELLQAIQSQPDSVKNSWLEFIFRTKYTQWLESNVDSLDPENLIRAGQLLPEKRESIELLMSKHIRTWSDFLMPGDYDELIQVFGRWAKELGRSDILQETLGYVQVNHKKKRKLLLEIQKAIA